MLKFESISKTFHANSANEVRALRNVSLSLQKGSFTAIIGTNGSGKSSLLNAVAGTFMPDSGSIHLAGHNITHWPEYKRASFIGRVFQNPFAGTAPDMTIAEAESVVQEVYDRIDPEARLIWGAQVDNSLENTVRTMIVVTGVKSPQIYGHGGAKNVTRRYGIDFVK